MTKLYEAVVNLNGVITKVTVNAKDTYTATKMIEAQYGKSNVRSGAYQISK